MHNIDANDLVYEQDELDPSVWFCNFLDPDGNLDKSGNVCVKYRVPVVYNDNGTINYAESYTAINTLHKHESWESYRTLIPSSDNPAANVYVNGQIKRVDRLIGETEGQELVDIVESRFPAYDLETCNLNVVGSYGPYRPPYTAASSISFYDMEMFTDPATDFANVNQYVHRRPPHSKYNVDLNVYTMLMPWFGYKFNLDDDTVSMKIVHRNRIPSVTYPPVPEGELKNIYYARIHNEDGTIDNMNDVFFDVYWDDVQRYCTEHDLDYPIPEGVDATHVLVWGIVFNGTTGVPVMVKGYESRDVVPT
jgi:hypothetical protein